MKFLFKHDLFHLILFSGLIFFYGLQQEPLHVWDEALYANNALEMKRGGDPLVLKLDGAASLINTKPPLVIWMQALSMKVFGENEFAVRFPTALAGMGLVFLLLYFFHKLYGKPEIGGFTLLLLLTSTGFTRHHVMGSGDLDGILMCLAACYSMGIFYYCLNNDPPSKRLILFIVFSFLLAWFCKSTAALLPLPGLIVVLLLKKRMRYLLAQKTFQLSALFSIVLILGFYLLRENAAPGYLDKVWYSEFSRLYNESMSWHVQPWNYYFSNLVDLQLFYPHIFFLIPAILLSYFNKKYAQLTVINFIFILSFFICISIPRIKLEYYDAPVYPFLSIALALGASALLDRLPERWRGIAVSIVLVAGITWFGLYKFGKPVPAVSEPWEKDGYVMRELGVQNPEIRNYTVLLKGNEPEPKMQAFFYMKVLNAKGWNIRHAADTLGLQPGDTVLCMRPELFGIDSSSNFKKFITNNSHAFRMYEYR